MHVVHICATSLQVPPTGYGGTERLVFWLAREQQAMGLRVSVIAHPASRVVDLLPGVALLPCTRDSDPMTLVPPDADVLHLHRVPQDGRVPDRPYLVTEHGLRKPGAVYLPNTVFVSRAHARLHGSNVWVNNGVPVAEYRYAEDKQGYLLFMARMEWPRKNARTAIDLAIDANVPIHITGSRSPWRERRTWGRWVLSQGRARRLIHSHPYVDGEPKLNLLRDASALFHVVNWHEPFSLVAHEALASGTPIIASPNGALADFVVDGVNGALVRTYAEALEAVRRFAALQPAARRAYAQRCRESAATAMRCAADYVSLYQRVIAGERLDGATTPAPAGLGPVMIIRRPWRGI
jgi:glycosyltransferase involved in cell wall biosynthesis